ncbi:hypothetical protein [Haloferax sp. ATB1]|uniref:hypothetical protein n=1 Tax=Haloferax sp. ATB1 TaxID=1508454 RepID=UPI0005B1EE9A|nr:hypothetical protein [Haloferax sp. ATB1]
MRRRALLSTVACGSTALLTGCNFRSPDTEIDITARNDSSRAITLDLFFKRGTDETVYSTHYELDSGKADESKQFTGQPDRVYAILDESEVAVKRFVPTPCSGTNTVPVGVSYGEQHGLHIGTACSQ